MEEGHGVLIRQGHVKKGLEEARCDIGGVKVQSGSGGVTRLLQHHAFGSFSGLCHLVPHLFEVGGCVDVSKP